jgi:hypothetical protein
MKLRPAILVTVAICLLAPFATTSYACFCLVPDVPQALENAQAVFVGEVVDIVEPRTSDEDAPLPGRFFTIKFKVEKSWKGVPFGATEFELLSGQGKSGCFDFPPVRKGERYLVYAGQAKAIEKDWIILAGCGNRTSLIEFHLGGFGDEINAYHDMKQLDLQLYPFLKSSRSSRLGAASVVWDANPFHFTTNPSSGKPAEQH